MRRSRTSRQAAPDGAAAAAPGRPPLANASPTIAATIWSLGISASGALATTSPSRSTVTLPQTS